MHAHVPKTELMPKNQKSKMARALVEKKDVQISSTEMILGFLSFTY